MLIDRNLINEFNEVDAHKWRLERYWNEECDNLIKTNVALFKHLYETKGGAHKLPGEKIYMSIQEFVTLMNEANFINEVFTERDVVVSFNLAKQTEIDEINNDKHMKLYFVEFLEAMARCADILSLAPNKTDEEMPQEFRKDQPLARKLENMLPALLKICKKGFIERYKFPTRDPETGLFTISLSPPKNGIIPTPSGGSVMSNAKEASPSITLNKVQVSGFSVTQN
jgi:hypothetical protein